MLLIIWEVKKWCDFDGETMQERDRQLDTPKNHSQPLAKKLVDFESILLHFWSISDPKMDAKSNQNIVRKQIPWKIIQTGVSEIDPIRVNRG